MLDMRSLPMKYPSIFTLLFILLQTGCGWQLRGSESNSLEHKEAFSRLSVFVDAPSKLSSMDKLLQKSLKSLGVKLDNNAKTTIELISERIEKRAMAYGSTGLPIQYQITITTQYVIHTTTEGSAPTEKQHTIETQALTQSLLTSQENNQRNGPKKAQQTDISAPEIKKVISRRSLDFDPELVAAKDNEEQELHTEMREEISRTILRDLRKLSASLTSTPEQTTP